MEDLQEEHGDTPYSETLFKKRDESYLKKLNLAPREGYVCFYEYTTEAPRAVLEFLRLELNQVFKDVKTFMANPQNGNLGRMFAKLESAKLLPDEKVRKTAVRLHGELRTALKRRKR